MRVLGIETATARCGVAMAEGDSSSAHNVRCLAQYELNIRNIHSEKLISMVERILSDTRTTVAMLDVVAVSIGPGSFTGLRIGLSTAKGLAYASEKPLIAVPTLDALAYRTGLLCQLDSSITVCPMLDARRDEVYYALYRWEESEMKRITDYGVSSITNVAHLLNRETIVVGDGATKIKKLGLDCVFPETEFSSCSPTAVALLGLQKLESDDVADVQTLEPFYLKDFVTTPAAPSAQNGQ